MRNVNFGRVPRRMQIGRIVYMLCEALEGAFDCRLLRAAAPKARNMIARGKRDARRPWIVFAKKTLSPEGAK